MFKKLEKVHESDNELLTEVSNSLILILLVPVFVMGMNGIFTNGMKWMPFFLS